MPALDVCKMCVDCRACLKALRVKIADCAAAGQCSGSRGDCDAAPLHKAGNTARSTCSTRHASRVCRLTALGPIAALA